MSPLFCTQVPNFPSTLLQELCRLQGTLQTLTEHIFLQSWPYIPTERSVYVRVRALPKQPRLLRALGTKEPILGY